MRHLFSGTHRLLCAGIALAGACFIGQANLRAQGNDQPAPPVNPQTATTVSGTDAQAMQQRLDRARALAATHNLLAAQSELDAIRNATTDNSIRDLARVLLMSIYLEQSDQARSFQLLDEAFSARKPQDEGSNSLYFALAGKVIKGARARMDRYREFGLNVTDRNLPADAENDLNRLRLTLEKVINQAKDISEDNPRGSDALALLEDAAMVRCSLARNDDERGRWQNECVIARGLLTDSETRVASISNAPDAAQRKAELAKQAQPTNGTWSQPVIDPDLAKDAVASNSSPVRPAPTVVRTAIVRSVNDPSAPANIGSLSERATRKVAPGYPSLAKTARITGIVRVEVVVDDDGNVSEAKATSGPEVLRGAAADAAKRWKFQPNLVNGQKVRFTGFITFNFTL